MSKKYSELSPKAQLVAQKCYQDGWNETHPNDVFIDYQQNGEVIGHE